MWSSACMHVCSLRFVLLLSLISHSFDNLYIYIYIKEIYLILLLSMEKRNPTFSHVPLESEMFNLIDLFDTSLLVASNHAMLQYRTLAWAQEHDQQAHAIDDLFLSLPWVYFCHSHHTTTTTHGIASFNNEFYLSINRVQLIHWHLTLNKYICQLMLNFVLVLYIMHFFIVLIKVSFFCFGIT